MASRWIRNTTFSLALFGAALSEPGVAVAAPKSDAGLTTAIARERYHEGVTRYAAGQYADAAEAFRQADRLEPSAALSFNIARAFDKLGDVPNALRFYREYLRRAPEADDARKVERVAHSLEQKLAGKGLQQVTISSDPAGATIVLDGEPVGVTPWTSELPPGGHSAVFRVEGRQQTTEAFSLPLDHAIDVSSYLPVEVPAAASPPPPVAAPEPPKPAVEPAPRLPEAPSTLPESDVSSAARSHGSGSTVRTLGFISLGTGAAALGGALTFEILRRNAEDRAKKESEQIRFADDVRTANSFQTDARVLAAVGAGLAVVGGALLVFAPSSSSEADHAARVKLDVGLTGASATVVGKF